MTAKRIDLNVRTFLLLNGSFNPLGQTLAEQLCERLAGGSVALILDDNQARLQALEHHLKQKLNSLGLQILTGLLDDQHRNGGHLLEQSLWRCRHLDFERTIIVHNEGESATNALLEPQRASDWLDYVQQQLYAPVALNQRWLSASALAGIEKLVINVTSSLQLRPLVYGSLLCTCKRARDMYFRSMAAEELCANVLVLNYAPGLMVTHHAQCDENGNHVAPEHLITLTQLQLKLPRVQPLQAALKLVNILEKTAFVSGHEVDYYDTFIL